MNRSLLHVTSRVATAATVLLFTVNPTIAQTYPDKPIRMVLPFPPGGGTDSLARVILPKMSQTLGQPIVIDNRPGAGGIVAAEIVAKSAPDGYTLFMGSSTGITAAPSLYKLAYDPIKDFAPITQFATASFILTVHPSLPVTTISQLVALARAKPGSLNYASGGIGSPLHLSAELFKSRAGINIVHVPYKGGAPALTDLIGGQIQLLWLSIPSVLPHVKAGRIRAIAVSTQKRSASVPEVPTVAESGYPGFDYANWNAFFAPAKTPPAHIRKINGQIVKALNVPDIAQRLIAQGADPAPGSPEDLARYMRVDHERWKKVISSAGIRPQ